MIIISNIENKIKQLTTESTSYIVTDFDRTITKGNSKTSWSILS